MPISPTNTWMSLILFSLPCAGRHSPISRTAALRALVWMGCVLAALECAAPAGFGADSPPVVTNRIWTYVATVESNATFHVDVSGTPPIFYQWQRNDMDIPGATNSTYAIPSVGCFDSAIVRVIISNAFGTNTTGGSLTVKGCVQALVNAAAPGGTVMLPSGVFYDTVFIDRDLVIHGAGMTNTTIDGGGFTLSSNVIIIASNVIVTLRSLTIRGGYSERNPGAGVYNFGNATLEGCHITGNVADQYGGGIANEGDLTLTNCLLAENSSYSAGAIYSRRGNVTVTHTVIMANRVREFGATAVDNEAFMRIVDSIITSNRSSGLSIGSIASDAVWNSGTLVVSNTPVFENSSERGGGFFNSGNLALYGCRISNNRRTSIHGSAGVENYGTALIQNCQITGHSAGDSYPGGVDNRGWLTMIDSEISGNRADYIPYSETAPGGMYNSASATANLMNCTINGNKGQGGAGIGNRGILALTNCTVSGNETISFQSLNGGGIRNKGALTLIDCTVYGNEAQNGGGVFNEGLAGAWGTILAGNISTANQGADVFGPLNSLGYNLIQQTNDATITNVVTGNLYGVDPLLGPLQNNGGPTPTHAFLPRSPAIDAGSSTDFPATDQRGVARPVDGDGDGVAVSDIGAFEFVRPRFASVERTGDGWLRLRLFVGASEQTCVFESSNELMSWTALSTNQADAGGWATMDVPPDQPKRFFRAVLP